MKTTSKIFVFFFYSLGVFTAGAAAGGAKHQLFTSGICALMAIALTADKKKRIKGNTPSVAPEDVVS